MLDQHFKRAEGTPRFVDDIQRFIPTTGSNNTAKFSYLIKLDVSLCDVQWRKKTFGSLPLHVDIATAISECKKYEHL